MLRVIRFKGKINNKKDKLSAECLLLIQLAPHYSNTARASKQVGTDFV